MSGVKSEIPPLELSARLTRLRSSMRREGSEALIATSRQFCQYIAGPDLVVAQLLVLQSEAFVYVRMAQYSVERVVITPRMAEAGFTVRVTNDPSADAAKMLYGIPAIAIEYNEMPYAEFVHLKSLLPKNVILHNAQDVLADICTQREPGEVARIESAAEIVCSVLNVASEYISSKSEAEVAIEIDRMLGEHGARESVGRGQIPQIRPYVAYGANACDVTHSPNLDMLRHNDTAIISAGAVFDGYWAVETRTIGESMDAQVAAIQSITNDLWACTQQLLLAGYGVLDVCNSIQTILREEEFIGLAPHAPCFSIGMQLNDLLCSNGDTRALAVCIEPGLYIPGKGGARIGRTSAIASAGDGRPFPISFVEKASLRDVLPYFPSVPISVSETTDIHTSFLIGDYPGDWGGGV